MSKVPAPDLTSTVVEKTFTWQLADGPVQRKSHVQVEYKVHTVRIGVHEYTRDDETVRRDVTASLRGKRVTTRGLGSEVHQPIYSSALHRAHEFAWLAPYVEEAERLAKEDG